MVLFLPKRGTEDVEEEGLIPIGQNAPNRGVENLTHLRKIEGKKEGVLNNVDNLRQEDMRCHALDLFQGLIQNLVLTEG